jgi:hypothetical protein
MIEHPGGRAVAEHVGDSIFQPHVAAVYWVGNRRQHCGGQNTALRGRRRMGGGCPLGLSRERDGALLGWPRALLK